MLHFIYPITHCWYWVASTCQLLWILLGTLACQFLCEHAFSVPLGVYLGVGLLDHMVPLCLTLWGPAQLLYKKSSSTILYSYQQCMSVYFLNSLVSICYCLSSILAILEHMKWYLIVVLIWISLIINSVEHEMPTFRSALSAYPSCCVFSRKIFPIHPLPEVSGHFGLLEAK